MPSFLRWSAFRLRTKAIIAVALPVVPLACFWLIMAITHFQREVPTNTTTRSLIVQASLARVYSALLEADAAARDHLLTENDGALERYEDATTRLPAAFAELNNAVIDPPLRTTLTTLNGIADDELILLGVLTGGLPAPADLPRGERALLDRSVRNLNRVREVSLAIEQRQAALTAAADQVRQRSSQTSFVIFFAGSVLCVGAGFVAALLTSTALSRRVAHLAKNADRLARGEGIKAVPKGDDEIAHLHKRFRDASQLLRRRDQELRQANHELEAFSYSVSHDLRAPLRAIDGFSQIVDERAGEQLDEVAQDALSRVRAAAARMDQLIDELLHLSHVTRSTLTREPLDLGAAAEDILLDLAASDPARHVDIDVQHHLVVEADPHMVRIALQNLLDNAWKYTGKTTRARIEVGSTPPNGRARVFHVRDNGAGFDMRYADKLFGAFQRLHAPQEFDGTGVGLATVQRIVHRHGGRIWAQAAVGSGATFYFTLEPEDEDAIIAEERRRTAPQCVE